MTEVEIDGTDQQASRDICFNVLRLYLWTSYAFERSEIAHVDLC